MSTFVTPPSAALSYQARLRAPLPPVVAAHYVTHCTVAVRARPPVAVRGVVRALAALRAAADTVPAWLASAPPAALDLSVRTAACEDVQALGTRPVAAARRTPSPWRAMLLMEEAADG